MDTRFEMYKKTLNSLAPDPHDQGKVWAFNLG